MCLPYALLLGKLSPDKLNLIQFFTVLQMVFLVKSINYLITTFPWCWSSIKVKKQTNKKLPFVWIFFILCVLIWASWFSYVQAARWYAVFSLFVFSRMYLCQLKKKINKIKTTSIARVKHKAKLNQSMHIQHIRLVNSVEGVCSPSLFHSIIVCSVRGKKTQHC